MDSETINQQTKESEKSNADVNPHFEEGFLLLLCLRMLTGPLNHLSLSACFFNLLFCGFTEFVSFYFKRLIQFPLGKNFQFVCFL